jgi:hypothetical protein
VRFNVRQILALTTTIAIVLGALTALGRLEDLRVAIVAGYCLFLAAWVIGRGPHVISGLNDVRRRRKQLLEHRLAMEQQAQTKRTELLLKEGNNDSQ